MNNLEELEKRITAETDKYQGIPVALSGGVDSSLLSALIKPKFVISVELPGDTHNEIQYSKKVAKHLGLEQVIVKPDETKFDEYFEQAVKAIGRPIPHFNIFPLWCMYQKLAEMGEHELILGDGPDETMSGYTRNLIMEYLYDAYNAPAFKGYHGLIDAVLKRPVYAYTDMINKPVGEVLRSFDESLGLIKAMNKVDMELMRPDMDDMSNKIAEHFGIKNIRPYQDNLELDDFMFNLPDNDKIGSFKIQSESGVSTDGPYGKFLLRRIAAKYLPGEIAWRLVKVGGPVYPVNQLKGWTENGEFDKTRYLQAQSDILNGD